MVTELDGAGVGAGHDALERERHACAARVRHGRIAGRAHRSGRAGRGVRLARSERDHVVRPVVHPKIEIRLVGDGCEICPAGIPDVGAARAALHRGLQRHREHVRRAAGDGDVRIERGMREREHAGGDARAAEVLRRKVTEARRPGRARVVRRGARQLVHPAAPADERRGFVAVDGDHRRARDGILHDPHLAAFPVQRRRAAAHFHVRVAERVADRRG